jgi:hypothetical protein
MLRIDEPHGPAADLTVEEVLDGVFLVSVAMADSKFGP